MGLVTTVPQNPEPNPVWPQRFLLTFDRGSLFGSRTVYYLSPGNDGRPVSVCARPHEADAFVYVNYGVSMQDVRERLRGVGDPGFRGYQVEHEEEVSSVIGRTGSGAARAQSPEMR